MAIFSPVSFCNLIADSQTSVDFIIRYDIDVTDTAVSLTFFF